jgi:hypothetical protein
MLGLSDKEAPERCVIAYNKCMSEVIVQGVFSVDPNERDRFVEASIEGMRSSRQEDGCLEYVIAADPLDPERAVLSERSFSPSGGNRWTTCNSTWPSRRVRFGVSMPGLYLGTSRSLSSRWRRHALCADIGPRTRFA